MKTTPTPPSAEGKLCPAVHPRGARCGKPAGHDGNHTPRNEHHCHAVGCHVATKPEMLMCLKHWHMVPRNLQREVWRQYRPGQCDDRDVSPAWFAAADFAIAAVAEKEGKREAAAMYRGNAEKMQARASEPRR